MKYTQNKKIMQVEETTLVVGIDIASEEHYARAFDWRGVEVGKVMSFSNSREGFEKLKTWMEKLKKENKKEKIICGEEPTGHYWFGIGQYLKEEEIKLVLVNPYHVKRSKELDDNSPTKTDKKDPKTIAKLVIDGRYSEPYIAEKVYSEIRILNEIRMSLTKEKIIIKNKVERWLKIYFPEYKEVFSDWSKQGSLLILKQLPLPEDIRKKSKEEINEIWRAKKLRAVGMKRAEMLKEAAEKSIGSKEGLRSARKELEILIKEYELKEMYYTEIMDEIEIIIKEIKNAEKLLEIKGIGLGTVVGLIAEIGDISRFESAKQIQKLAGLSLMETSSGKHKGETSITRRGRKRLRQILFQAVMPLVAKNEEFKELHNHYITREKNALRKKQSIVAISCKLIRVVYAILKNGTRYEAGKVKEAIELKKAG